MGPTWLFGVKYDGTYLSVWSKVQWNLPGCLEYNTMGPTWYLENNTMGPTWVFGV